MNTTIEKLGLNANQIQVYLTLLQMGSGSIQEIAKKSGMKRTTTYSILDTLIQKNLAVLSEKGTHREYVIEDPKKIPNIIERHISKMERDKNDLLKIIPELSSLYNIHETKPKIKFYEGVDGLKRLFEETLILNKGEEILAYASAELVHKYFKEYVSTYIERRAKKGIVQRAIAEDSPEARIHQQNDQVELRKTRIVDRNKFPISNEINIFRNKMFIASYKDLMGVLIESAEIAKTQRSIFELAWMGAREADSQ